MFILMCLIILLIHTMTPFEVTSDSYAEYNEDFNVTKPKFKVGDHFRISKYKTFTKEVQNTKDTLKIGQKNFLLLVRSQIQFLGLT